MFFSRCPGCCRKQGRKKIPPIHNKLWRLRFEMRKKEFNNEIRAIKLWSCCLRTCIIVSTATANSFLLPSKTSQYPPFMQLSPNLRTTRFCIESPVLRSSNHFQDGISPILRLSLRGKEEACIVISSVLHTVKTRQVEVK